MYAIDRRPRRGRFVAAVTVAVGVWSLVLAAPADAIRPTSESAEVAGSAQRALDALETWQATDRPSHYIRFVRAREHTAELLAADVGVDALALATEWESGDDRKMTAMLSALTQLGVPYRTRASEPGVGFDCSGLTSWAWREAGVEIARTSSVQIREADEVDEHQAEAGDLVYYPGHVSMYVGQGFMVHSPTHGRNVEVTPLSKRTSAFGDPVGDDTVVAATSPQILTISPALG